MSNHFDELEIRTPAAREAALFAALPVQVASAQRHAPALAAMLEGVDAERVTDRAALARLPVTRKHELLERQKASRAAGGDPFGGFSTIGWNGLLRSRGARRVYQSPGPIYEPEGNATDYWRCARAMAAAGFKSGDLVHNCFSYHLTPAGSMMETAAHGNTEQQLAAIADLRPQAYSGTPSFLKILVEKAQEAGVSLPITKALVSGEAFPPSLRDWLAERGITAYQCYATADVVTDAMVEQARVRPGTGDPVPDGEVGEVVVTVLNPDYPLIRFGTGDLSAVLAGPCPTGRTAPRIKGWMGRADQTTKIRGMFVHPSQVAEIVRRFPDIVKARLVVTGEMANDHMTLKVETSCTAPEGLHARVGEAIRDVTKLRGDVEVLLPGSLPNDGKVIEDARSYR